MPSSRSRVPHVDVPVIDPASYRTPGYGETVHDGDVFTDGDGGQYEVVPVRERRGTGMLAYLDSFLHRDEVREYGQYNKDFNDDGTRRDTTDRMPLRLSAAFAVGTVYVVLHYGQVVPVLLLVALATAALPFAARLGLPGGLVLLSLVTANLSLGLRAAVVVVAGYALGIGLRALVVGLRAGGRAATGHTARRWAAARAAWSRTA